MLFIFRFLFGQAKTVQTPCMSYMTFLTQNLWICNFVLFTYSFQFNLWALIYLQCQWLLCPILIPKGPFSDLNNLRSSFLWQRSVKEMRRAEIQWAVPLVLALCILATFQLLVFIRVRKKIPDADKHVYSLNQAISSFCPSAIPSRSPLSFSAEPSIPAIALFLCLFHSAWPILCYFFSFSRWQMHS